MSETVNVKTPELLTTRFLVRVQPRTYLTATRVGCLNVRNPALRQGFQYYCLVLRSSSAWMRCSSMQLPCCSSLLPLHGSGRTDVSSDLKITRRLRLAAIVVVGASRHVVLAVAVVRILIQKRQTASAVGIPGFRYQVIVQREPSSIGGGVRHDFPQGRSGRSAMAAAATSLSSSSCSSEVEESEVKSSRSEASKTFRSNVRIVAMQWAADKDTQFRRNCAGACLVSETTHVESMTVL